jgi:rubrerythrin
MKNFKESKTKENLMRAFSGESQARNRYSFASEQAKGQELYVIEAIFKYTADQECEHAKVFYNLLSEFSGENIEIDGAYPVDISNAVCDLLTAATHNENEEFEVVYKEFADVAEEEGFTGIAAKFRQIGEIERSHANRFALFAEWLREDKLFVSDIECKWVCLNCGNIISAKAAPPVCPVCSHPRGYFIRLEFAPYTTCPQN